MGFGSLSMVPVPLSGVLYVACSLLFASGFEFDLGLSFWLGGICCWCCGPFCSISLLLFGAFCLLVFEFPLLASCWGFRVWVLSCSYSGCVD